MTTSPLARPEIATSWLDAAAPGLGPTGSSYLDAPGLTSPDPEHDLGELNPGRSAVAYVLPSPTGKPLRWRTYLALNAARADADAEGREPGPPEAHGSGVWHAGRQAEVRIYPESGSPEWGEHTADGAAAAQDYYRDVFELRTD